MRDVSHRRVRILDRGLVVVVVVVDSIVQRRASSERGGETRRYPGRTSWCFEGWMTRAASRGF